MSYIDAPSFDETAKEKDGAFPRFFKEARQNKFRSEADGVPRFDDIEMVEINIPGDRNSVVVHQVKEEHRRRWPKAYAAFKEGEEGAVDGTPIGQLPGITQSRVQELMYFRVLTIEQLAGMPDDLLMKVAPMDGRALRDKAIRWVEVTAGDAPNEKLAAENRELRDKMGTMERQLAELTTLTQGLQAQLAAAGAAPVSVPTTPAEN